MSLPNSELALPTRRTALAREMGLVGLTATGIASMIGVAIQIIPVMLQKTVPGIGPYVLPAFLVAAIPAMLAGLAYAVLASAMPRAGGSYVYASRGLNPYLGFIASFSQWFALCVAIGVVSYVLVPFVRDLVASQGAMNVATALDSGTARLTLPLAVLWTFTGVNLLGVRSYERILVPLVGLTIVLVGIVIIVGFRFNHADYSRALAAQAGVALSAEPDSPFNLRAFGIACTVLFSTFIGFDSIAQAGGEATHPERNLPLALGLAVGLTVVFYMLFTSAVYHAVPWWHVAAESAKHDVTAPGLLAAVLPAPWPLLILVGAVVALVKDLPAMLLSVSRLMFAWADDGIFPRAIAAVHPRWRTPYRAILASALMSSLAIVGCHLAGSFFLGVDILVTASLVNFILICMAVLTLPARNPSLASAVRVLPSRTAQRALGVSGIVLLSLFLLMHTWKDLTASTPWYLRSTPLWVVVMAIGSAIYAREVTALRRNGTDVRALFATLPPE